MWPSRSPDLTVCDFHLWGYLKNKVYAKKPPHIRRNERLYQDRYNNRTATNASESEIPITVPKMCGCRRTTFPTSFAIRYVIFTYVLSLFIITYEQSEGSAVHLIYLGVASRSLTALPQQLLPQARPQVERN